MSSKYAIRVIILFLLNCIVLHHLTCVEIDKQNLALPRFSIFFLLFRVIQFCLFCQGIFNFNRCIIIHLTAYTLVQSVYILVLLCIQEIWYPEEWGKYMLKEESEGQWRSPPSSGNCFIRLNWNVDLNKFQHTAIMLRNSCMKLRKIAC